MLSSFFSREATLTRRKGKLGSRKRGQETLVSCPLLPPPPGGGTSPHAAACKPRLPGRQHSLASCVRPQERRNRSRSPSEGEKGACPLRAHFPLFLGDNYSAFRNKENHNEQIR